MALTLEDLIKGKRAKSSQEFVDAFEREKLSTSQGQGNYVLKRDDAKKQADIEQAIAFKRKLPDSNQGIQQQAPVQVKPKTNAGSTTPPPSEGGMTQGQQGALSAGGAIASNVDTGESQGGGVAKGAITGASAGSAAGPWGAAIGAAVGGVAGGMQAKAKSEARKRDAQAEAQQNISNIQERLGQQQQTGIQNLIAALRGGLI